MNRAIEELQQALLWIKERADTGGRRLETAQKACEEIEERARQALGLK